MSRHLFSHQQTYFLPKAFFKSEEYTEISLNNESEFLDSAYNEGRKAIFEFSQQLFEMGKRRITFKPIKFEVEGEVDESPFSDMYRCLSLFDSCFESDWPALATKSPANRFIYARVLSIGKSRTDCVVPLVDRKTPFPIKSKSANVIETFELMN